MAEILPIRRKFQPETFFLTSINALTTALNYKTYIHFNTCITINADCYLVMTKIKHCYKTNTSRLQSHI